jgi:hypothetical protein
MLISERFEVTLSGTIATTGSHSVLIPIEIASAFAKAGHKRIAIKAFFENKEINFHGALHFYKEQYLISFGKRYQKELGIFPSDYFELQLLEDQSKYGVEVPGALQAVMDSDPKGFELFESLTPGKKRSLIYYIARFKTEQTQVDKALIIFSNLKRGIRDQRELIKSFLLL